MKEAIVGADLKVKIVDNDIPVPKANQLVIKVVVSGSNPKDWYVLPIPALSRYILLIFCAGKFPR